MGYDRPVYAAAWGWIPAAVQTVFGATLGWLLLEIQMIGLEKLPFTCAYVPGKANLKSCWPLYVLAYLAYVAALSWLDLKMLEAPPRMIAFLAAAVAARLAIERYRRAQASSGFSLVFDERPDPAVHSLGLGG